MKGLAVFFVVVALMAIGLLIFDYELISDTKGPVYRSGEIIPSETSPPDSPPPVPTPAEPKPPVQPLVGPPSTLKQTSKP